MPGGFRLRAAAIVLAIAAACSGATSIPKNRHGLAVVDDPRTYRKLVAQDDDRRLVELKAFVPSLVLDVRYATKANFMNEVLYPAPRAFARRPAAEALRAVQNKLAESGLGLKIYDAYRPYAITERMWEKIGDPDYVADPSKGSRHNRGAAVDVTLVKLETGEELVMPTAYDDFTKRASHEFADLPAEAIENRRRLREVMEKHGFEALPSEWWHYDFRGWREFELLDLSFDEL